MSLPAPSPSTSRLLRVTLAVASLTLVLSCAGPADPTPRVTATPVPTQSPAPTTSADPPPSPATTGGAVVIDLPTACYGLGEQDCRRVSAHAATLLATADPNVRYVQVGPFGCGGGQRCPTTLAARPEGDVTFESEGGGVRSFHITMTDGVIEAVRQEAFGISLPPRSLPPVSTARQPFTLGHCGLWSGVDVGGSWWDPVGFVDADHGDSINAAEGMIAFFDPDHAVFASKAGLTVQLLRRDGEKFLPFCD